MNLLIQSKGNTKLYLSSDSMLTIFVFFLIVCSQGSLSFEQKVVGIDKSASISSLDSTMLVLPSTPTVASCQPSSYVDMESMSDYVQSSLAAAKFKNIADRVGDKVVTNSIIITPLRSRGTAKCSFVLKDQTFDLKLRLDKKVINPIINFKSSVEHGLSTLKLNHSEIIKQYYAIGKAKGFHSIKPKERKVFKSMRGEYLLYDLLINSSGKTIWVLGVKDIAPNFTLSGNIELNEVYESTVLEKHGKKFLLIISGNALTAKKLEEIL